MRGYVSWSCRGSAIDVKADKETGDHWNLGCVDLMRVVSFFGRVVAVLNRSCGLSWNWRRGKHNPLPLAGISAWSIEASGHLPPTHYLIFVFLPPLDLYLGFCTYLLYSRYFVVSMHSTSTLFHQSKSFPSSARDPVSHTDLCSDSRLTPDRSLSRALFAPASASPSSSSAHSTSRSTPDSATRPPP